MAPLKLDLAPEASSEPLKLDLGPEAKPRVSNPGKQAIASGLDLFSDIPGFLGIAGQGIETLADYALDDNDKTFGETFEEAGKSGADKVFSDIAHAARKGTNKLLDIEEPVSTEDQLARNLALFAPIPSPNKVKALGKIGKILFDLVMPTVKKGTKTNMAVRGGLQGGFGLGIEQGVRALADLPKQPLLFSDQALAGGTETSPLLQGPGINTEGETRELVSELVNMSTHALVLDLPPTEALALDLAPQTRGEATQDQLDMDLKLQRDEAAGDITKFATYALALLGGSYATKRLSKANKFMSPLSEPPKPNSQFRSDEFMHEQVGDRGKVSDHTFREMGVDDIDRQYADNSVHVDSNGIARESVVEGDHGQGFDNKKWKSHSSSVLDNGEAALRQQKVESGGTKADIFNAAMKAQSELSAVRRGKRERSLWREGISDAQLDERVGIAFAKGNEDIAELMRKHSDNFRADIEYEVHRGSITKGDRDDILDTFGDITKGDRGTYMPFYSRDHVDFLDLMSRKFLGWHSKKGDELDTIAKFRARGGQAKNIMNANEAAKRHRLYNVAYVNEQLFKSENLSKMAGIATHADDVGFSRLALKDGKFVKGTKAMHHNNTGRGTHLLGVGHDIKGKPDAIHINVVKDDELVKGLEDMSINDLKALPFGKEIISVQHKGKLYVYRVPDAGVRAAMELNPRLNQMLEFNNHWKNVMQRFTTGDYSLFAPISHAFSAQQVASTTVGRYRDAAKEAGVAFTRKDALKEGAKSFGRSLGGSKDMFMDQMAGILADHLANSIALQRGIGKNSQVLQRTLHDRYSNSLLHKIRSETGRTNSSWGTTPDTLQEMADGFDGLIPSKYAQPLADFYGTEAMGLIKNVWKAYNNAANEGPAYGVIMREMGKHVQEGKVGDIGAIRKAVESGKTHAGDMSRRGANPFVQGINATIPFSSAMIQSWNALGSAARADWRTFSIGVGALIGAPTMMELSMNAALSMASGTFPDASGKEWTYDDYYWNGLTTQQRADNMIIFVPGQPPWEAAVIPISPEWGLFRSVVMEGADAIFNLSNVGAGGVADQPREQLLRSMHRVFDIPLPPVLGAVFAAGSVDLRAGANVITGEDPEAPETEFNFLQAIPIGTGERITSRLGRNKDVNGFHDKTTSAFIRDLWGAGGTAYIAFADGLASGITNEGGSVGQGVSEGLGALVDAGRRQARYLQPLPWIGGKTFKTSANDEIGTTLHGKRQALQSLAKDAKVLGGGENYIRVDGKDVHVDTVVPTNDPIRQKMAAESGVVMSNIAMLDKTVAKLRNDISKAGLATTLGTRRERQDIIDGKNSEIQAYKAMQLAALKTFEDMWSEQLTKMYKRDITVNLSGGHGTTIEARD